MSLRFFPRFACTLALLATLGFVGNALAQEKRGEIGLYGDISSTDTTDMTMFAVHYGIYLSPQMVLKLSWSAMYNTYADDSETDVNTLGAGLRYYFQAGKAGDFVPFVGASLAQSSIYNYTPLTPIYSGSTIVGYSGGSSTSSATGTEFELGFSYFVSESASFDVRLYQNSFDYGSGSVDTTGVNLGTTIRF